jgi:RimJ/RimL family protein N-acetyltransferase
VRQTWRRWLRGRKHGTARGIAVFGNRDFGHDHDEVTRLLGACACGRFRIHLRSGGFVIFRPAAASDLERLMSLLMPDPATMLTPHQYEIRSSNREYRPEWTWVAEESPRDPPVAVAIWWGNPRDSLPAALDGLFARESAGSADRASLAAGLLGAAHEAFAQAGGQRLPSYHLFLPGDWHDRPDALAALAWREEAARRAGLTARLERLRYEWTPHAGLPDLPGRLAFRAEADDEVFTELFRRVLAGTLDMTSRNEAEAIGPETQARMDVKFYREDMLGERSWWRIAWTPDGQIAGFGIPSRNTECPVVGYLGVLPEHRGHGYVDEILAEITRVLAAEADAAAIGADTDLGNLPMAAAFERAGYRNVGRRLVLSAG